MSDVYLMCRSCLNFSSSYSHIFTELLGGCYVYEVLKDVCQLEVSSDDELPEYVCCDCHKKLSEFHSFKLQTHEGNAVLHRIKGHREKLCIGPGDVESDVSAAIVGNPLEVYIKNEIDVPLDYGEDGRDMGSGEDAQVRVKEEIEDPLGSEGSEAFAGNVRDSKDYIGPKEDETNEPFGGDPLEVSIKQESEDALDLEGPEVHPGIGQDVRLPWAGATERGPFNLSEATVKENTCEGSFRPNAHGTEDGMKGLYDQNLVSNGRQFVGAGSEIQEGKMDLRIVPFTRLTERNEVWNDTGAYGNNDSVNALSENGDFNAGGDFRAFANPNNSSSGCCEEFKSTEAYDPCDGIDPGYEAPKEDNESGNIHRSYHESKVNLCEGVYENAGDKFSEAGGYNGSGTFSAFSSRDYEDRTSREIYGPSGETRIKCEPLGEKESGDTLCSYEPIVELYEGEQGGNTDVLVCDSCGKEFSDKNDLLRHVVIHYGRRDFGCLSGKYGTAEDEASDCIDQRGPAKTRRKKKVKRQWKCRWCDREFAYACKLKIHELVHTGEKPFACKHCPKKFALKSNLTKHEFTHRGIKPFRCQVCDLRFYQRNGLKKHAITHVGKKPFQFIGKPGQEDDSREKQQRIYQMYKELFSSDAFCNANASSGSGGSDKRRSSEDGSAMNAEMDPTKQNINAESASGQEGDRGANPDVLVCQNCGKEFLEKSDLLEHAVVHYGEGDYGCVSQPAGDKNSATADSIQASGPKVNRKNQKEKVQWKCKWCDKQYLYASALKTHELVHTGEQPFPCKYCRMKFSVRSDLEEHESVHVGNKPHACQVCDRRFCQRNSLTKHERTHLTEKLFQCEVCDKKFTHDYNRKKHLKMHEMHSVYSGGEAIGSGINASSSGGLENMKSSEDGGEAGGNYMPKEHEERDSFGDEPRTGACEGEHGVVASLSARDTEHAVRYQQSDLGCSSADNGTAGFEVSSASNSARKQGSDAISKRDGKVPWNCNLCDRIFSCASALKKHEAVHTGEKRFACKYCPKRFSHRSNQTKHEFTHSGIKPFACTICEKRFFQRNSLKKHAATHLSERQFECELCGKTFRQDYSLKKHQKIHDMCNLLFSCEAGSSLGASSSGESVNQRIANE